MEFQKRVDMLITHFGKFNKLNEEIIERVIMSNKPEDLDPSSSEDNFILHGVGGKIIKAQSFNQQKLVALAKKNDVTLDVGFYYMANAMGRLLGCIISGFSYQIAGLIGCFVFAGIFLFFCSVFSFYLKSY